MRRFLAAIAAAGLATLTVAPAGAAALAPTYVSSEPSDGEELHQAPDRVEITFSEPLDESSELSVEDSCGRRVDDGNVTIDGSTMSVGIALKPSGHYQVDYTATGLAGVTGSTEGGFHFMVHFGDKCGDGKGGKGGKGGHDNHGGNNTGGSNNNQHNDHSGGGSQGGQHSSGGGHTSTGSTNHAGSATHGSGHSDSMGSTDDRHGGMHRGDHKKRGKKQGQHSGHRKPKTTVAKPDKPGPLAGGSGQPLAPDGRAVMLALAFSLVLGTLGGWFLRVSAAR